VTTDISWLGPPIDVRPLFAPQQAAFTVLLSGLGPAQWAQPTICPGWDVKDVAAHVLGDHGQQLRLQRLQQLSALRPSRPLCSGQVKSPSAVTRLAPSWHTPLRARMSPD
jgi:uncharacterized protein (TIGR03083 family)